jgi:hypothetical protein
MQITNPRKKPADNMVEPSSKFKFKHTRESSKLPVLEDSDFWLDIDNIHMYGILFICSVAPTELFANCVNCYVHTCFILIPTIYYGSLFDICSGPEIGKGEFSNVYVGKYFGDLVAVKKQTRNTRVLEEYLLRELSVLKLAHHKNLVTYIGAYDQESEEEHGQSALYIITELCTGGDFLRVLLNKNLELEFNLRIKMAMEIAKAMDCLHSKNLIHRDIKSSVRGYMY